MFYLFLSAAQQQPQQDQPSIEQQQDQVNNWDFWPEVLPAIGQQGVDHQVEVVIQQQQQQPALLQDLNVEPDQENPLEVIIHPPQAVVAAVQNIELDWEHLNDEEEMEIAQPEPQLQPALQQPEIQPENPPQFPAFNLGNLGVFIDQELPADAIMNDAELADQDLQVMEQPDHFDNHQVGLVRIVEDNRTQWQYPPSCTLLFPVEKQSQSKLGPLQVEVPQEWADFLHSLLKSPPHNGFKQSPCGKANCLVCSTKPPTLSNSVIRMNLGKELGQIDPELSFYLMRC